MTENQRGQQEGKIIDDFPNCFQGYGAPKPGSNGMKVEDTKVKQELRLFYVSEYSSVSTNRLRKWLITFKSWRPKAPLFALEHFSPPVHIQCKADQPFTHSLLFPLQNAAGLSLLSRLLQSQSSIWRKARLRAASAGPRLTFGMKRHVSLPWAADPPTVRVRWDLWAPAAPAPPAAAAAAGYSRRAE